LVGEELNNGLFVGGDGYVHFINDSGLQMYMHPTEVKTIVGEGKRIEVYDARSNEHIGMFYYDKNKID
jgi:hypothetical protein